MKFALQFAEKGRGKVAPNPMVGCVIVKDDKVIAEGYHQQYGGPHAEVNAINSLPSNFDFTDCTLYVNLEPCSHYGKTPPCSDLIISKKFKRVVVGNLDTNPLVAGKGIQNLKDAGIEVSSGIINSESRELNKRFFWFHEKKQPYVILKWAETKDGFISREPLPANKEDNWITSAESKKLVHQWRAEEQAIMVGTNTVIVDDPELTTRLVDGNNPVRVIIDRGLKLPRTSKVFSTNGRVIIVTDKDVTDEANITYCKVNFDKDFVKSLLNKLFELSIQSLIIEGGSKLLNSFIEAGAWNEARVFVGEKEFEKGIKAPVFDKTVAEMEIVGVDKLYTIKK
ncbi:MAG: bifunctional diaminohydroxyphosphoribosylaminopyrimidine deaminase/5-amino-6-(5-phosphoribosylamino)uracil reductase RibD [Bacteroidetes bacterium]|nr:bifunctional diaminohydroxyphosphoribosylaminopyrimidine deaminase/5-amino-6-(5-phosphoribosylamino)uracil reductase RibD [Bacteroidota bacterium]